MRIWIKISLLLRQCQRVQGVKTTGHKCHIFCDRICRIKILIFYHINESIQPFNRINSRRCLQWCESDDFSDKIIGSNKLKKINKIRLWVNKTDMRSPQSIEEKPHIISQDQCYTSSTNLNPPPNNKLPAIFLLSSLQCKREGSLEP